MNRHTISGIEILVIAVFVIIGAVTFVNYASRLNASQRDEQRKTALNTIAAALESVHYPSYGSYPSDVSSTILPSVPQGHFTDPDGQLINDHRGSLHYEPSGCSGTTSCKSYVLRADLERESQYTILSKNKP